MKLLETNIITDNSRLLEYKPNMNSYDYDYESLFAYTELDEKKIKDLNTGKISQFEFNRYLNNRDYYNNLL